MRCPFCGNPETSVKDSRTVNAGLVIRRRRECSKCGRRFTTYERRESELPVIIKKDERREDFNREKVLSGLKKACEKRPIYSYQLDQLVNKIEANLMGRVEREIPSDEIGKMAMELLKSLDKVAYVRFASVYRDFQDVGEFTEVISDLNKKDEDEETSSSTEEE